MTFLKFIKEKILTIILIVFSLITIEIFFMTYPLNTYIKIYTPIIIITSYLIGLIYEYNKKKKYYNYLEKILNQLKEKYLITEVIKKPEFIEGKILYETLEQINKSMHENVNKYKYNVKDYKEYKEQLLERFELLDKRKKFGDELSKGMQQKLSICCGLLPRPQLILFDEPMIGLDPHAIKELKKVFEELKEKGCCVLVSTHMIDSIEELWDTTYIMKQGKIA